MHFTAPHKILNITNGDYFNKYFLSKFGGDAIPFREAMMEGKTLPDIYSEEFFYLRAKELGVSVQEYKAKACVYDTLQENHYDELHLWFGKDTFCQMNLLTLLAYLEIISYMGRVFVHYIDDESFEIIESDIPVTLGCYQQLYADVFLNKHIPGEFGVLCKKAIELYFDYLSSDGALARLVRENADKDTPSLLSLLMENSKAYGLSSWQAEKLIKNSLL